MNGCSCPRKGPYFKRYLRDGMMTFYGYCLELWYDCEHSKHIVNVFTVPLKDVY